MLTFKLLFLAALSQLLQKTLASPFEPSLEHRQLGSCATAPCAAGLCCSQFYYCGVGPDYCQAGSCVGGVGGTCAAGACCSEFGYCQTDSSLCSIPPITTSTPTVSPTSVAPPVNTGLVNQWNQCGGEGWLGGTVCVTPYKCTALSIWYSQCE